MTLLPRIGWDTRLGSLNAFYGLDRRLRFRDRVVTPGESLDRAIREVSAGGSDPDGARICLAPGKYYIRGRSPMEISNNNIHIYAASPGQSIIRRVDDSDIRTAFSVTGSNCSISGVAFEDTNPTAAGHRGATVAVNGDRFSIFNCVFTSCRTAITVSGEYVSIRNNRIVAVSQTDYAVELLGTTLLSSPTAFASVHGNIIEDATLSASIYAHNGISKSSFVGNVCASTVAISYKNGQNNVNAGNVGTVTER
tara:strand:+ start:5470 stop:6225 length:756 start_codon:yes stop_codon:yes gene_type:complete